MDKHKVRGGILFLLALGVVAYIFNQTTQEQTVETLATPVETTAEKDKSLPPPPVERKPMVSMGESRGGSKRYKEYEMEVTAYDLSYESCGKHPNHPEYAVTASGKKIGVDIFEEDGIIASPENFPFGTKMEVEGWGTGTVWDRGGAIKYDEKTGRYRLDIFISDRAKALDWGRKIVKVKVFQDEE